MNGDPALVHAAADTFRRCGAVASGARTVMGTLGVESWRGLAADAFDGRRLELTAATADQSADLAAVARILDSYATELASVLAVIEAARARMRAAWGRLLAIPPDLTALRDLAQAQGDLRRATLAKARVGGRAAENLYALIHPEDPELTGLAWPPSGWPQEAPWNTTPLPSTILDDASFDPADVKQGQIGDCYLLATLMTLMGTDEGKALLRDGIRWDPDLQGYWVTLYVDGEPTPFFVDRAIKNGASERGGPGVATLYEAAMREYLTYADLNDGGWAVDTYPLITGADATHRRAPGDGWDYEVLREDRANNGYMVASTPTIDSPSSPERITVQRPTPYGMTYQDEVSIAGPHVYAVVAVTDDGVWLMNPHGPENNHDGGGRFLVSAADFDRLFSSTCVGGVPG